MDHFQVVEEFSVGGATEKTILRAPETGALYIAKLGRRNNDLEVMTEYAITLIGRSLGVSVADARIAAYKGQLRFLSCYFLDRDRADELVHGVQLFNALYDETSVMSVLGDLRKEQELFNVQSVKDALGAHYLADSETIFGGFIEMLTHDALIGVQDRHHENWGVILQRELTGSAPRFAPLYDSARGLFCNIREEFLSQFTSTSRGDDQLDRYVAKAHPLVGFSGLEPVGSQKCIAHDQLLAAIYRRFPEQRHRILRILAAYDWRAVRYTLRTELGYLCTPFRLQLILTCLRRRLRLLRRAISAANTVCGGV